jgi:hypothetical protein
MNGESLSHTAQWIGFVATVLGLAVGIGSLAWAWVAASRAKGAREAAQSARQAAIRLGRVAQLGDLIADVQELQTMLAREDLTAVSSKANHLRGRIVRLKSQAYTELRLEEQENLDAARDQLQLIVDKATGKASQEHKIREIQRAYGLANEALNRVAAIHAREAEGA